MTEKSINKPEPYEGNEPYIVISYSHKDEKQVWSLIQKMSDEGYRIWYDYGIALSSTWNEYIAEKLLNCEYCIAFISEHYIQSEVCKNELSYAHRNKKNILLAYLSDVKLTAGMDLMYGSKQAIFLDNFHDEQAFLDRIYLINGINQCKIIKPQIKETVKENDIEKYTDISENASIKKERSKGMLFAGFVLLLLLAVVATAIILPKYKDDIVHSNKKTESKQKVQVNQEKEYVLPYTGNNVGDLTKDDFVECQSEDGSYSFAYPKFLFNHSAYDEKDGYYLYNIDTNGNTTMILRVYKYRNIGDPIKIATKEKEEMKKVIATCYYEYPENIAKRGKGEDDLVQVVINGWSDYGKTTAVYILSASDGTDTYRMEIYYPDYVNNDDREEWDYIVDTLYTYCSFSGTTREPYENYEEFLEEN